MLLQLNPPIPVQTPKGKALAQLVIDYGPEHDLLWVCFEENGECWTWGNPQIRAQSNITMGRPSSGQMTGLQGLAGTGTLVSSEGPKWTHGMAFAGSVMNTQTET